MKNIFILPTDKPSQLFTNKGILTLDIISELAKDANEINQNIYITSDEEIKEGDWWYSLTSDTISFVEKEAFRLNKIVCKKIIITTDQDLIDDGVKKIDDDFLRWFVKNSDCEFVETKISLPWESSKEEYEVVIPQEKTEHKETEEVMKERSSAYEFIDFENKTNLEKLQFPELVKELSEYYKGVPIVEKEERLYTEKDIREAIDYGANLGLADDIGNSFQWTAKQNEFISRKRN